MKSKAQKELEQERQVAQYIYDIGQTRADFDKLIQCYRDNAYEAVKMGQDEYAKQLLKSVVRFRSCSQNLSFIELKIKTIAMTSKIFKQLKKLPVALNSLKQIFGKKLNFGKLGKDMAALDKTLEETMAGIDKIADSLGAETHDDIAKAQFEMFGSNNESEAVKKMLAEEEAALEIRLGNSAATPATVSAAAEAEAETASNVDDIARMIEQEKNK